jgi:anti-sigma factor ChrR (cupin superfamily)
MSCLRAARILQSHVDGELDEVTARRVAAHVAECRRCGLEVAVYREIKDSLARKAAPSQETLSRLMAFGQALADGEDPGRESASLGG